MYERDRAEMGVIPAFALCIPRSLCSRPFRPTKGVWFRLLIEFGDCGGECG